MSRVRSPSPAPDWSRLPMPCCIAACSLNPVYNLSTLIRTRNSLFPLLILVFLPLCLLAQQKSTAAANEWSNDELTTGKLLVVIHFENVSTASGLDWLGEAFAQLITTSISSPAYYTIGREDRSYAFDRLGIPIDAHLSRATVYRIGEQMDVDYLIFGSYNYDGTTFTGRARLLDMRKQHLSKEAIE